MKKVLCFLGVVLMLSSCTSTSLPRLKRFKMEAAKPIDIGDKVGKECATWILGIFGPFGSVSLARSAKSAGITSVTYYETSYTSYFFFGKECLNVYGR